MTRAIRCCSQCGRLWWNMTDNVRPYNIRGEIDNERRQFFFIVTLITGIIIGPLFALEIAANHSSNTLPVSLWLLVPFILTLILRQKQLEGAATWVYLIGLVLMPTAQVNIYGPDTASAFLFLLPT